MKHKRAIIKGICLTALVIGLMCLNVKPVAQNQALNSKVVEISVSEEIKFADYFVTEAFALTPEEEKELEEWEEEAEKIEKELEEAERERKEEEKEEELLKFEDEEGGGAEGEGEDPKKATTPAEPYVPEDFLRKVAQVFNWSHYIFSPFIFFFTNLIGGLLGSDYIFGGKMGEMLKDIWIISRNIVNIVFVLILLYLAVKQIFFPGEGEGGTELKKALPKFVIMLIAINFSWLATRVVIDAANVATNVVFAIPSGIKGTVGECKIGEDNLPTKSCMPGPIYFDVDTKDYAHFIGDECPTPEQIQDARTKGGELGSKRIFCWYELDYSRFSRNNAAYYITYGMAQITHLTRAHLGEADLKGITKTAFGFVFSIVMEAVYLIAIVCLFLALLFRVAFLWIFVALSPFLVLLYYLKKDMPEFGTGEQAMFSISSFMRWAFVPAKVGVVFSLGFILITTGQTISQYFQVTAETAGGVRRTVLDFKTIFQGMSTIQDLLWLLMSVVIVWVGVFGVLTKLEGVSFAFEGIKRYFQRAGKFAAKAGVYAPIFPLGEAGEKVSIAEAVAPFDLRARFRDMAERFKKPSVAAKLSDAYDALRGQRDIVDKMDNHFKNKEYKQFIALAAANSRGNFSEDMVRDASLDELKKFLGAFGKNWQTKADEIKDAIRKKAPTRAAGAGTAVVPPAAEKRAAAGAAAGAAGEPGKAPPPAKPEVAPPPELPETAKPGEKKEGGGEPPTAPGEAAKRGG